MIIKFKSIYIDIYNIHITHAKIPFKNTQKKFFKKKLKKILDIVCTMCYIIVTPKNTRLKKIKCYKITTALKLQTMNKKFFLTLCVQCGIINTTRKKEVIKMTREQMVNTLKTSTAEHKNGAFAIVLYKKNFYTKKTFINIITTTDSYNQAQTITNELNTVYNQELAQCDAIVTFATTDIFTRGYTYHFAKQS